MSRKKNKTEATGFTKSDNKIREEILANENLGVTAYAVYMTILSFRHNKKDDNEGLCYPSINKIMEKCHLSRSTVNRQLTALYDEGYLWIHSGRVHASNRYAFPKETWFDESDIMIYETFPYNGRRKQVFKKGANSVYNPHSNVSSLDDGLDDDWLDMLPSHGKSKKEEDDDMDTADDTCNMDEEIQNLIPHDVVKAGYGKQKEPVRIDEEDCSQIDNNDYTPKKYDLDSI